MLMRMSNADASLYKLYTPFKELIETMSTVMFIVRIEILGKIALLALKRRWNEIKVRDITISVQQCANTTSPSDVW